MFSGSTGDISFNFLITMIRKMFTNNLRLIDELLGKFIDFGIVNFFEHF